MWKCANVEILKFVCVEQAFSHFHISTFPHYYLLL